MIVIEEFNIYEITFDKLMELIKNNDNNEDVENLLYVAKYKEHYIALDNVTNCFTLEEFDTKRKAICWLLRCDYDADKINSMEDDMVRNLINKQKYRLIKCNAKQNVL